jgi:hypothetical protein
MAGFHYSAGSQERQQPGLALVSNAGLKHGHFAHSVRGKWRSPGTAHEILLWNHAVTKATAVLQVALGGDRMLAHSENETAGGNGARSDQRREVLVWVAPEFLQSPGIVRILHEAELLPVPENKWDNFVRSAVESGGFALTGRLAEASHGAGIWISPESAPGLEVMIPWMFVRSVATAPELEARRIFGLARDGKFNQPKSRVPAQ